MMRLIGALSGLTIAINRLAETILPKPMFINFILFAPFHKPGYPIVGISFDILDLLANLLDFRFHIHHEAGDLNILAF